MSRYFHQRVDTRLAAMNASRALQIMTKKSVVMRYRSLNHRRSDLSADRLDSMTYTLRYGVASSSHKVDEGRNRKGVSFIGQRGEIHEQENLGASHSVRRVF
jgi:hypothetical protein